MQTIAIVTMLLSLLLIYNTVTAIIAQQTAQIGELKAIGASSRQILQVYITIVATYGLCALVISLPLSILAANGLRTVLVDAPGHHARPLPARLRAAAPPGRHLPAPADPRGLAAHSRRCPHHRARGDQLLRAQRRRHRP